MSCLTTRFGTHEDHLYPPSYRITIPLSGDQVFGFQIKVLVGSTILVTNPIHGASVGSLLCWRFGLKKIPHPEALDRRGAFFP